MGTCEEGRSVVFRESFRGIGYDVRATSIEEGVEIALPRYERFEDLITASGLKLRSDEIKKVVAEEYEKCLLEAVRRLRGRCE